MKDNALKMNPADNVVIAIRDIKAGEAVVVGGKELLKAAQNVGMGHKIALTQIKTGSPVLRYGEAITKAKSDIQSGEWVHLHNTEADLIEQAHKP